MAICLNCGIERETTSLPQGKFYTTYFDLGGNELRELIPCSGIIRATKPERNFTTKISTK